MTAGLKGNFASITSLQAKLRELPRVVAQDVAAAAASTITTLARGTFEAGENAYGDTWEPGAHGQRVTLQKSGGIASGVHYVAIGTRLRAVLSVAYARYQIGRRPVFPRGGASLPTSYVAALGRTVAAVVRARMVA